MPAHPTFFELEEKIFAPMANLFLSNCATCTPTKTRGLKGQNMKKLTIREVRQSLITFGSVARNGG